MLKGFCMFLMAALLSAGSQNLSAQVYRCETSAGVVYADMPCGDTAEEIQLDVVEPPSANSVESDSADAGPATTDDDAPIDDQESAANGARTLSDFSQMLEAQRETQINQIDQTLSGLKAQVASNSFKSSDDETRARVAAQIEELEASRESILDQYESMIAEAKRRSE